MKNAVSVKVYESKKEIRSIYIEKREDGKILVHRISFFFDGNSFLFPVYREQEITYHLPCKNKYSNLYKSHAVNNIDCDNFNDFLSVVLFKIARCNRIVKLQFRP